MNLYHLTQEAVEGYDTYSDCVVAAEAETLARHVHPSENVRWDDEKAEFRYQTRLADGAPIGAELAHGYYDWPHPSQVRAKFLGIAVEGIEAGVICSSFHAG